MKPMADTVKSDEFTYQIRCTAAVFLFQPKTDHDSICIFARSRRVPEDYGIRTIPGIRLEYRAVFWHVKSSEQDWRFRSGAGIAQHIRFFQSFS